MTQGKTCMVSFQWSQHIRCSQATYVPWYSLRTSYVQQGPKGLNN